jgi:hypothetical protein
MWYLLMHETWDAAGAEQEIYWAPSTGFRKL